MIDEVWIEELEKSYQETRRRNKEITDFMVKENRRRRRALLKTWIIVALVATILACINVFLRLHPVVIFLIGMILGSVTMNICISKFDL